MANGSDTMILLVVLVVAAGAAIFAATKRGSARVLQAVPGTNQADAVEEGSGVERVTEGEATTRGDTSSFVEVFSSSTDSEVGVGPTNDGPGDVLDVSGGSLFLKKGADIVSATVDTATADNEGSTIVEPSDRGIIGGES